MDEKLDPRDGSISVEEWWDYHHRLKGDYKLWLTGSRGPKEWRYLGIADRIRPGCVVLNIGVGLGTCTYALAQRKCRVHALDISPVALSRVAPCVERTWLHSSLAELPSLTFDLAISYLVAQHMKEDDLQTQVEHVVRSLKRAGIFAMQFAFAFEDAANDVKSSDMELMKAGGMCRSLAGMADLVHQAGGTITWANRIGMFPEKGSGWYAIHIVRRDYPAISSFEPGLNLGKRPYQSIDQLQKLLARTVFHHTKYTQHQEHDMIYAVYSKPI